MIHASNSTAIQAYGYSINVTASAKRSATFNLFSSPSCSTRILSVPGGIDPIKLAIAPMKKTCKTKGRKDYFVRRKNREFITATHPTQARILNYQQKNQLRYFLKMARIFVGSALNGPSVTTY